MLGVFNVPKLEFRKYLLSHPTPGAGGRTGGWRVYRPVVDLSRCTKCGLCWLYCPENAIEWLEDGRVSIDYDYCKGCGVCADVCPVKVIEMVKEAVV